jgi:hypothetical protein
MGCYPTRHKHDSIKFSMRRESEKESPFAYLPANVDLRQRPVVAVCKPVARLLQPACIVENLKLPALHRVNAKTPRREVRHEADMKLLREFSFVFTNEAMLKYV